MNHNTNDIIVFFSSTEYGGGVTFLESLVAALGEKNIILCSIKNQRQAKSLAEKLGIRFVAFKRLFYTDCKVIIANSQITGIISSLFFPCKNFYVTHGFANGLKYMGQLRRLIFRMQINIPGTKTIACGISEYETIKRSLFSKDNVCLIKNGLPSKVCNPLFGHTPSKNVSKHLAYIGRICNQKGLDILLEALNGDSDRFSGITLTVIGDFQSEEHEYKKKIDILADRCKVKLEWLATKQLTNEDFESYSAIIFPSRFEGLPYTLLEAGYTETTVIVSNCPGNRDIVPDSNFGFVFESEDPSSLRTQIETFLSADNQDKVNRRTKLKFKIMSEYSQKAFSDGYIKICEL